MRLYYYRDPVGNFGDDLNPWMWSQLLPGVLDDDASSIFVGVGTLLNHRIPSEPVKAVFGSGVGYGDVPCPDSNWCVYCVRGPRSARLLGLPADAAVTDAAMLLRLLPRPAAIASGTVFMPHHDSKVRAAIEGIDLRAVCAGLGISYVDPADPVETVLARLAGADVVIAEAMHAAIAADALRVPWVAVSVYNHISEMKWLDWCESLGMAYTAVSGRADCSADAVSGLLHRAIMTRPNLSGADVADRVLEDLVRRLDRFRADVTSGWYRDRGQSATVDPEPVTPEAREWQSRVLPAARSVAETAPSDATILLADGGEWWVEGCLLGRRALPFTEKDGLYNGPPSDEAHAISELERLREAGASHLAIAWSVFWWLDCYPAWAQHLRSRYRCVLESTDVVLFELR